MPGLDLAHALDPAHRPKSRWQRSRRGWPDRCSIATSMLLTTGMRGAASSCPPAPPSAARRPASSGWNGTAPTPAAAARAWRPALSTSQALSTAALLPAITVCGVVEVDGLDHLAAILAHGGRHLGATSYHFWSASSPRMAAMAPVPTGTACCMAAARRRTSGTAWASVRTRRPPGPSIRPANGRPPPPAAPPSARQARQQPRRHQHHRLGVGGQRQRFLGALDARSAPQSSPSVAGFLHSVWRTAGMVAQASSMPTACEPWPGKQSKGFHGENRKINEKRLWRFSASASSYIFRSTAPQVKPPPTPSSMQRLAAA